MATSDSINVESLKNIECEVCNIAVCSYFSFTQHINGRKHKKALELLRNRNVDIDMGCFPCNYYAKDVYDWEKHVTSIWHICAVKSQSNDTSQPSRNDNRNRHRNALNSAPPPLIPSNEIRRLQNRANENNKQYQEWNCPLCSKTCQSLLSYNEHLQSKRHKNNMQKFHTYAGVPKEVVKERYRKNFVRSRETISNDFSQDNISLYCKQCNFFTPTSLQMRIHIASDQHRFNGPMLPMSNNNDQMISASSFASHQPSVNEYTSQNPDFNYMNYGYGYRTWNVENNVNASTRLERATQEFERTSKEIEIRTEEIERRACQEAQYNLFARFPYYAANSVMNLQRNNSYTGIPLSDIPLPSQNNRF